MRALSISSLLVALFALEGCTQAPCRRDYGACEATTDCGGGATCESVTWSFGAGQLCAIPCETELDCPRTGGHAGRCLNVGTGTFLCYEGCLSDFDCDDGWVCQPIRSNGALSAVCMP